MRSLIENLAAAGRNREDIKVFAGLSFVVGSTEAEAKALEAEYDEYLDLEAIVAHIGGGLGVDLGGLDLDTPLGQIQTEGAQGVLEAAKASVPGGNPTLKDLAHYRAKAQQIVGTPESIVDELERWQDAGIDGLNIMNHVLPGSYDNFIEGVIPELRRRGLAQSAYDQGSLRQKVFGRGDYLPGNHPAAKFRGAFSELSAANTEAAVQLQS
ncbi:LLM class flavin-dependent oxidoreductase [Glutamicibacter halophytocola]